MLRCLMLLAGTVMAVAPAQAQTLGIDWSKIEQKVLPRPGSTDEAKVCATVLGRLAANDGTPQARRRELMARAMTWGAAFERKTGMASDTFTKVPDYALNLFALSQLDARAVAYFGDTCLKRLPPA